MMMMDDDLAPPLAKTEVFFREQCQWLQNITVIHVQLKLQFA